MWFWKRMKMKWSEKLQVTNEVLGHRGETRALLNNILRRKSIVLVIL